MGQKQHSDLILPPHNIQAEQAILGALLLNNAVLGELGDLGEADFYRDDHRRIFRHACRLIEEGGVADLVTVSASLDAADESQFSGGVAYLGAIIDAATALAAVPSYVRLVRQAAIKRGLMAAYQQAAFSAGNGIDAEAVIELTDERIAALRERASAGISKPKITPPLDWAALSERAPRPREWLIEDWLGTGHPTLFVGPGGVGKSLLAQQVASCLSVGHPILGAVARPLRVLMWMCEDDAEELFRRQAAIAAWLGVGLAEFSGLVIQPRLGMDNTLLTTTFGRPTWTPLARELREQCADYRADVWWGDNIGQMFGGNENVRHDVTMFLNGVAGFCGRATPIMLGHPSRGQGSEFSGSSAWENAVRMRWWFSDRLPDDKAESDPEAERDDSVRFLCKRKTNYSTKDFRQFRWENGIFVPVAEQGVDDAMRDAQARRVVIHGIERLAAMDVFGSEKPSATYLPTLLLRYGFGEGLPSGLLAKAMRSLMVSGTIKRGVVGKDAARRERFGLVLTPV